MFWKYFSDTRAQKRISQAQKEYEDWLHPRPYRRNWKLEYVEEAIKGKK